MVGRDPMPVGLEDPLEVLKGPQILREDEDLLVDGLEEFAEPPGLHVRGDGRGILPQVLETLPFVRPEERALGEASQRLRHRERAAADLTLQDDQGQPRGPGQPTGRRPVGVPHEVRDVVVEAPFRGAQANREAVHAARRQRERDAAAVADHHVPEASAQLRDPHRHPPVRARHVPLEEPIVRVQLAGFQEGDEVEELVHVVLDRRCGQEQHVLLRQPGHETPVQAEAVLESMGLVHDEEVPRPSLGRTPMGLAFRGVHGRDEKRPSFPIADRPEDGERQGEFRLHLFPPLARQRGRSEDEDTMDESSDGVLLEDQSRLDRLAEADLVGEDRPTPQVAQDPERCALLVIVPCDAMQDRPREEAVESVDEGNPMSLAVQAPRAGSVARRRERTGEEVLIRIVKSQGEGGICRGRALPSREGHGGGIPSPPTAGEAKAPPAVIIVWLTTTRGRRRCDYGSAAAMEGLASRLDRRPRSNDGRIASVLMPASHRYVVLIPCAKSIRSASEIEAVFPDEMICVTSMYGTVKVVMRIARFKLIVYPTLKNVARNPEAIPRRSGGTDPMIELMFGAGLGFFASPNISSIMGSEM